MMPVSGERVPHFSWHMTHSWLQSNVTQFSIVKTLARNALAIREQDSSSVKGCGWILWNQKGFVRSVMSERKAWGIRLWDIQRLNGVSRFNEEIQVYRSFRQSLCITMGSYFVHDLCSFTLESGPTDLCRSRPLSQDSYWGCADLTQFKPVCIQELSLCGEQCSWCW